MPYLEHLGLMEVHHVLIKLLMCPQRYKIVYLRVESALSLLVNLILLSFDLSFLILVMLVVDQSLVGLFMNSW